MHFISSYVTKVRNLLDYEQKSCFTANLAIYSFDLDVPSWT